MNKLLDALALAIMLVVGILLSVQLIWALWQNILGTTAIIVILATAAVFVWAAERTATFAERHLTSPHQPTEIDLHEQNTLVATSAPGDKE